MAVLAAPSGVRAEASAERRLQLSAANHVLAFSSEGLVIASRDHALRIVFADGTGVTPVADGEYGASTERGVAPLGRVTYREAWPGVTVTYEASAGSILRSRYDLGPGVPVERIRLRYNAPIEVEPSGRLVSHLAAGVMTESAPVAWQEINGMKVPVAASWQVAESPQSPEAGFTLGAHDPRHPVVIDPALDWNTFLGGGASDYGYGVALDSSGNVYVTGYSAASWGSPVRPFAGGEDAFVAKLDSAGNLIWSTFLGGAEYDHGHSVAVDGGAHVYVTGLSAAGWGSPVRPFAGGEDAFVAKLDSVGNLTWNTFLGGLGLEEASGIAVEGGTGSYVTGYSGASWGSPIRPFTAGADAFVARLDNTGNLAWNTFLGGSGNDLGYGIAVGGTAGVHVAGDSDASWGAPVRPFTAVTDGFVARLDGAGNLTQSTFLGGPGADSACAVAVDGGGSVYVAGWSDATWGSPVRPHTAGRDGFAAKLDGASNLAWNSFLGGSGDDYAWGIAVDGSENAYVAGDSNSAWGAPVRPFAALVDGYVAKLASGGSLAASTFLGGSGYDSARAVALDSSANAYASGTSTASWGAPVRPFTASDDVLLARLGSALPVELQSMAVE